MYLRPIWTKQKPYWALVKSVRQGRKVRQEVVAYLGSLPKREQSRARALAQRLGLKADTPGLFDPPIREAVVPIRLKGIGLERARQFGNVYLGMKLWEMAGFDRFFAEHLRSRKEEIAWSTTAMITTIARLCAPSSELRIAEHWVHTTALCDMLSVETIVTTLESRYGKSGRVWVWDRGMIRGDLFSWMAAGKRDYVMAVPKGTLYKYADVLAGIPRLARGYCRQGWEQNFRYLPDGNAQSTEIFRLESTQIQWGSYLPLG